MGLLLVVALYNQGKLQRAYARELRDFEQCVSCNVVTHIHRDEDIASRKYYIEGTGQLCEQCYNMIYNMPVAYQSRYRTNSHFWED